MDGTKSTTQNVWKLTGSPTIKEVMDNIFNINIVLCARSNQHACQPETCTFFSQCALVLCTL